MPYGGTTPEEDRKIERCVETLMREKGYDKVTAIKICKAAVLKLRKEKDEKEEIDEKDQEVIAENVFLKFDGTIELVE